MNAEARLPRTLIFSQRNLARVLPFRCAHFEFEDIIAEIDSADIFAPGIDASTRRYLFAKQLAYHSPIALNPGVEQPQPDHEYDLFLMICGLPSDLLCIDITGEWRRRCKKTVCLIDEVWVKEIHDFRHYLQMLKQFDLVVLYYSQSVDPINALVGNRCVFLPPGVDAVRFCPYPNPPERSVDVYSIGRRSSVTHQGFLKMVQNDGILYLHDSMAVAPVLDYREHRNLFANLARRSSYFLVNPGLIDRPDKRGTQIEIGNRYFEAAACGSVLLGERPANGQFERLFDWTDALIDLPYNAPDPARTIAELSTQPERIAAIRSTNVHQSLLRHDWAYRWEQILGHLGMSPLEALQDRKNKLRSLAALVHEGASARAAAS